ncbi:hypothetical protein CASFOL_022129 [Castilleja foliolosa]|uniref:Uncharacterized protein n=1 Tax=Castilleja foliolosa TaxID=1961234 RepID=A0ABD3CYK2_9LAMI
MIEAERLLFEEAVQDPANQRFVLLSVRYAAELKNNRATYTFSFDQMLNDKGNTDVYLRCKITS